MLKNEFVIRLEKILYYGITPLRSSRFRYINVFDDVVFGFEIAIVTRKLTIPKLPKERKERLEFIYQIRLVGYSNRQISEYFNSWGIKT